MEDISLIAILWEDSEHHKVCNDIRCLQHFFPSYDGEEYEVYFTLQRELYQIRSFSLVWGEEGIVDNVRDVDSIIGKVCDVCHTRLGDWCICAFCGCVVYGLEHDCSMFSDALNDENHPLHQLACDYMDGTDTDTFLYEFTEDQL